MDSVVVGNLCQDPSVRQTYRGGYPYAKFTIAAHSRRRVGDEYVDRPTVFHQVVCFGQLAENVGNSLRKGMEVVAVGDWADDTHTDGQGQRRIQIVMEARAIGPNLRWATAQVSRAERRTDNDTIDMFATANTRQPPTQPPTRPTDPPTPAAGLSVVPDLPTPDPDPGPSTHRRKKPEPELAISQAG